MISSRAIYYEILGEDLHEHRNILVENLRDNALKSRPCGLKVEHHHYSDERAPIRHESGLFLFVRMYAYLAISAKAIQKIVHLMPRDNIKYTIREWKGEDVCDHDRIKLPVDKNADFPILL